MLNDSNVVQTEAIQKVIDLAGANGGGVVVIPQGTFLSGSLFFKPNTHLHVNGVLKVLTALPTLVLSTLVLKARLADTLQRW